MTSSLRMSNFLVEQRARLDKAAIENATGKHSDMGLALGAQTGTTTSFRSEYSQLESQLDTNKQLITRLDVTNTALTLITDSASSFRSDLITLRDNNGTLDTSSVLAFTELDKLVTGLNSNVGGVYVFGGIDTGSAPVSDFKSGPEAAIEAAFFAEFGHVIDDPLTASISVAAWETFLDGPFAAEFDDTNWAANWSGATDDTMTSTIDVGVTIPGSASSNEDAYRNLAQGLSMVAVFGKLPLTEEVGEAIMDRAIEKLSVGVDQTISITAQNGAIKTNVERTNTNIEAKQNVLNLRVNDLENVDPNRAAIELSLAQTQLEATYAITAKIQNLNIMKYL
ncbi:flagellar hook-associated family protein [Pseudovibrio sp. Tun.PSC04-5.I4]|uniref:flagellar hook-associated family protein n=1 Tax=Pseudovibrio sp. Tun.PSC04-5.I4 TaxID=1798213 RepID=UPI001AD8E468|nr:flagellar hook-associated family protein [Pseudovibrio sp. Tun.PSC04-5.I4]